ncbi:site-specific DNA-methyltransferase [Mesorhizobium denitrificans]|uniref:site-specific DNA-methyltransferase (adenine-specific) n=1 Tax=Mesorhizobium denitrificans TaxID=2294114 RepID=A0A371XJ42_9HYPH|nr:DNA methyltransferase [Mesorhizobium denitrificans]RFC69229.1 site-specific DNA-methyltransferase [Mesorhizobium denitrificans]
MSRLTDLIAQTKAKDAALGLELEREFKVLSSRRSFGLNFERHRPESVELPGRPIRKGDKVRILPPRGETKKGDQRLWKVLAIRRENGKRFAELATIYETEAEQAKVVTDDLIVVAEFRDYIYPGLVSTGKVERGGDKPFHTVINGENFHALEALTYTHRGKIDVIYIDPPYNTGAKDWKYNNDYVEGDDIYRHSKWLAFMERRLQIAAELLNAANATLIVTIDEKEYLRLGLLLEQIFPEARIQMVSSVINPKGATRSSAFGRTDEYLFFVMFGNASPAPVSLGSEWKITQDRRAGRLRWAELLRSGSNTRRVDSPNQFYPVFIRNGGDGPEFHSVGDAYFGDNWKDVGAPPDCVAVWPIRSDGSEGNWQNSASGLRELIKKGYAKLGNWRGSATAITYIKKGEQNKVETEIFPIVGRRQDNSIVVDDSEYSPVFIPGTQWRITSHNAEQGGTNLQKNLIPNRRFPFPKSLYAVEDALRFFVKNKKSATILDFFSGSGTTAHAVMRLNRQDGGRRQCISVTNNEVAAEEQSRLRNDGLRPGNADWEKWGICDYITKPRIAAAITGKTPEGKPIEGDYKFTDEFPIVDGFEENAEFFTLTYEAPVAVSHNRAFERIAPLLWIRAGSEGRPINKLPGAGWEVVDTYGLLTDLDMAAPYCAAIAARKAIRVAYIVTDDERRFQSVARQLPTGVEPVRLYESYLTNFRFSMGR